MVVPLLLRGLGEAKKLMEVLNEDDDEDDNTKMKLKRGKVYGILDGNDSGKSTLMRAIANNQVEGFQDTNEVRTVFVEVDIQGEQSHLSCIEYIFVDEKIQVLGCTNEEVKDILAKVAWIPYYSTTTISLSSNSSFIIIH